MIGTRRSGSLVVEDKTGLYPFRLTIDHGTDLALRPADPALTQPWLRSRWVAPLELLIGQNSLPVFCSSIVFGFVARLGLEYDDGALMQIGINLFGVAAMVAVGALAAWYRTKGQGKAPRGAPIPAPTLLPVNAQTDTG